MQMFWFCWESWAPAKFLYVELVPVDSKSVGIDSQTYQYSLEVQNLGSPWG